jgi:ubiquinone/menaquinone biosynthesis C-methylase UbiE
MSTREGVARAYDAASTDYEDRLAADVGMRRFLWRRYARLFRPGAVVMDLGCGTGIDTIFLAGRGVQMIAVDASPGMLDRLRAKARRERLDDRIEVVECDIGDLGDSPSQVADGIISAFASLNTVGDLRAFADEASRMLRSRGQLVVHMLGPAGAGPPPPEGERTIVVCGEPLRHRLLPARETYTRFFAHRFRLRRAYGLGYRWLDRLGRLPAPLSTLLRSLEARAGSSRRWMDRGRFFVLEMERAT